MSEKNKVSISLHRRSTGRWLAQIKVLQKTMHLGSFGSEIEAARAYDAAAKNHFGQFARLNMEDSPA